MTTDPAIRLVRPLQQEYLTVGYVIRYYGKDLYNLTEQQFVNECMARSGGSLNPNSVRLIYLRLMEEAGITNVERT